MALAKKTETPSHTMPLSQLHAPLTETCPLLSRLPTFQDIAGRITSGQHGFGSKRGNYSLFLVLLSVLYNIYQEAESDHGQERLHRAPLRGTFFA